MGARYPCLVKLLGFYKGVRDVLISQSRKAFFRGGEMSLSHKAVRLFFLYLLYRQRI